MTKYMLLSAIFLAVSFNTVSQIKFDDYFINKTLRLDYNRGGNANETEIFFVQLKQEPFWGGNKTNLIDKFGYGDYIVCVYDSATNKQIYSRGYSSLFKEWKDTEEAKKLNRTFYESVIMPFPKKTVKIVLKSIDKHNIKHTDFELYVNPDNYFIKKEEVPPYKVDSLVYNGDPAHKVDIVFIPEGYTKAERKKMLADAKRFASYLFEYEPYTRYKNAFNFWLVESFSLDSGTDIPGKGIWKRTVVNSNFYTFDTERYLTTTDIKSVRDIAACAPYDQIYILVNTKKYGGGGIYNYYNLICADNYLSKQIFVHEFGHAFAGLADEYEGDASYEANYDFSVEPREANITTLADFDKKWKDLVDKDTPIPTPKTAEYQNKVGAFEGGGYLSKGIYRPMQECMMRSFRTNKFCPVCQRTIEQMIKFQTE